MSLQQAVTDVTSGRRAAAVAAFAGERLPLVGGGLAEPRFIAAIAFSPSTTGRPAR
jgi:hypothetical protein